VRGTCKAIGEIDMATAPAFKAELRNTIDESETAVIVIDCSDLTFMDVAGYHVLVDETRYAARRNHTLVIRNMSLRCATVIDVCDWDNQLHLERPEVLA